MLKITYCVQKSLGTYNCCILHIGIYYQILQDFRLKKLFNSRIKDQLSNSCDCQSVQNTVNEMTLDKVFSEGTIVHCPIVNIDQSESRKPLTYWQMYFCFYYLFARGLTLFPLILKKCIAQQEFLFSLYFFYLGSDIFENGNIILVKPFSF